jgi:hypothetical protein
MSLVQSAKTRASKIGVPSAFDAKCRCSD